MRTHTLGARAASPRSPMTAAACRREERPMGEVTRVKSAFSLLFKGTRIEAAVPPRKPLAKLPAVWSTSAVCLAMIAGLAAAQENRTITLKELCLPSGPVTRLSSPDGSRILYGVPYQSGTNDGPQLWIEDTRTHQRKMLLSIGSTLSAVWSPDGTSFSVQDHWASDSARSYIYDAVFCTGSLGQRLRTILYLRCRYATAFGFGPPHPDRRSKRGTLCGWTRLFRFRAMGRRATSDRPLSRPYRSTASSLLRFPISRKPLRRGSEAVAARLSHKQSDVLHRPIKGGTVHVKQPGNVFAAFAVIDQLPGVGFLLRRQFRLASEFHAPAFRGLHSGAGPFADKAAFKLGQNANHLPHGPACRRLGVDCFREGAEFHAPVFQVVEHGYQVVQAAA